MATELHEGVLECCVIQQPADRKRERLASEQKGLVDTLR